MNVIVVGMGVIGTAVADLLSSDHVVRRASRSAGDLRVDATSLASIEAFYESAGYFDALVMAIGNGKVYTPFWDLLPSDYDFAYYNRVMTQINLVRLGVHRIADNGSFTLSSGFMNKTPMPGFSAITASNGAIDGFIAGAAKDMQRGIRINGVSASFVRETMELRGMTDFGGLQVASAKDTARAYQAAVEGHDHGRDFTPDEFL
jgi:NAD(P)-dependent dehydrogenase (short-subunit alcohol dehydrogenase family)